MGNGKSLESKAISRRFMSMTDPVKPTKTEKNRAKRLRQKRRQEKKK